MERFCQWLDRAFGLLELALYIAAAALGGWVVWSILSDTDAGLLARIGWTAAGSLVSAVIWWVVWSVMKLLN